MPSRVFLIFAGWLLHAGVLHAADVILNEYNAVGNGRFLEGDGEDPFWGRTEGNGGDWFELAIVTDHLDMRGWRLVMHDDVGDDITLTLTDHEVWSDLRSGTIVTVSEELENNAGSYKPAVGRWWLNVKAADDTNGTFITASNFRVRNNRWQLMIQDASGTTVFGPAGEGINPPVGVSEQEVLKLEADPTASITPFSNYQDGQSSSFGLPNMWNGGADSQDFGPLRSVVPYSPLMTVRINEVLTHTDAPTGDWIELHNTTDAVMDVGGWYLTDDVDNLAMSSIASGTSIPPHGYLVVEGHELDFALSAVRGDEVYLSGADGDGQLTGERDFIEFGPAENDVSFGRRPDGIGRIYPLIEPTPGAPNSAPRVGPVVISEIMYAPRDPSDGTENLNLEYVELHNITGSPVDLWTHFAEVNETHPWRLADGVRFEFSLDTVIAACGHLLVVGFDPDANPAGLATFRETYGLTETVPIVGPYDGRLSNSGDTVGLRKPDQPQDPGDPDEGLVPYVLIDEVPYSNRVPWPEGAGQGFSLERIVSRSVGDVSTNWAAGATEGGTPGTDNSRAQGDTCEPVDDDDDSDPSDSGGQRRLCGAVGMFNVFLMMGGLVSLRKRRFC